MIVALKINRLVAVYLETHCNMGWKRAFTTGVLDRSQNRKYITYRNDAGGIPSHGHRQHAQESGNRVATLLRH